jgi:hypothetical protein
VGPQVTVEEIGDFGVWCQCSGMLGFREAWLKRDDNIRRFATMAKAQAEAQKLMKNANSNPYSHSYFNYYADKF